MPERASRICAKCPRIAVTGTRYCTAHQGADMQREQEYKASNELRKLYNAKRWRVTRLHVLCEDPQCTYVGPDGKRCLGLATDVHHTTRAQVLVARLGIDAFYDPQYLAGLCHMHHSQETATEVGFAGWNIKQIRARVLNYLAINGIGWAKGW